jgi:Uma2 family endonuclease
MLRARFALIRISITTEFWLISKHRVKYESTDSPKTRETVMSTTTRVSFEEFIKLPEDGRHYELDEGKLVMEPSATFRHNFIRDQIAGHLRKFVKEHRLGRITVETDFRLGPETVRNPDVAFITEQHRRKIDIDRTPVPGAPALAVEVVSPSNSAEDMMAKIRQYLAAGSLAVWVVYPGLRLVEVHDAAGTREVVEPALLKERGPFGKHTFSLPLTSIFDEDEQ